jgi:FKBP-type peptidyl-prolyl cis-trans isomerase
MENPMNRSPVLRRKIVVGAAWLALGAAAGAQNAPPAGTPAPPTAAEAADSIDASSYSLGLVFGNQLHSSGLDDQVSLDAVMRGLKDGLGGKELAPADRARAMKLMRSGREALGARNRAVARDFLASNAAAPGVKTTASGLQYEVLAEGDPKGASPTLSDRVTVHYRGRLLDGTEFDNSDNHALAPTFSLNGVIKGWREALLLMKQGAKWRLFVPPELGYDLNSPPSIPPGSLLVFDLELVKVEARPVMVNPGAQPKPPASKPASPHAGE